MTDQAIDNSLQSNGVEMHVPASTNSESAAAARCNAAICATTQDLWALRGEWRDLYNASPTASAPLRWEWVWKWWSIYGPIYGNNGKGLRIITLRKGQQLIGVLPMYESTSGPAMLAVRKLRFISTGAKEFEETCAEYLNLLHAPGEEAACIDALADLLLHSQALKWDELELHDLPEDSPLAVLKDRLSGEGRKIKVESPGVCYISDLSGGLEQYLAGLSGTTRKKARKTLRAIETSDYVFEIATTAEQAGEFFDELVQMHKKRWEAEGKTGSFAPRHHEFHRGIAVELAPSGQVALGRLKHRGKTIAMSYGHRVGKRFEGYQLGIDHTFKLLPSSGAGLHLAK